MSYVEKAFYQYIKNIFTSGFRILFSKKYFFYTIAFFLLSITSTTFYLIGIGNAELKEVGDILIIIELSFAITYVCFGLFFARFPVKYWGVPAFLAAAGGSVFLYFFPIISPFVAIIGYMGWIFVSIFLTFSLSRNFWGSRILGSVMFLGKRAEEGTILFSGVVFILSLINAGISGYLIYLGISTVDIFLIVSSISALIAIIIVNIIIFSLGKNDDVFYTILAFFYIISGFNLWKLLFYTISNASSSGAETYNIGGTLSALFLIFYTVSNYAKKLKKIEEPKNDVIMAQIEDKKKKEEIERIEEDEEGKWGLLKIPNSIGPLGILMIVMGLVMSYHVTYLQLLTGGDIFSEFFISENVLVGLKDKFGVVLLTCILIFYLLNYLLSKEFRKYASPTLYRFEFLPPYEELIERINKVRSGEDSWKQYANMLIKQGVKAGAKSTAQKVFVTPTKKVAGAIGGAYTTSVKGVKKGFSKVFRRKSKKKKS
ncbi:MAG: hypothetical protein KAQ70_01355 [Candidatus Heimdallarchaeota archaeon]|nr:hypothetical protein [Candidatus Heimdallarchaeota archaeon]